MSSRGPTGGSRSRSLAVIKKLRSRASRQSAIARLGEKALTSFDVDALCDEATRLIGRTLRVDLCTVLELLPDQTNLRLRAAHGLPAGQSVDRQIELASSPQVRRALADGGPVVLQDVRAEARAALLPYARQAGVTSGLIIAIPGPERPLGVVTAHAVSRRVFADEDVDFLKAMANVLGTALHRRQSEEDALRLAAIVESSGDAIIGKTLDGIITSWNAGAERLFGYHAEEVVGGPVSVIYPDSRAEELAENLAKLRLGERIHDFETIRVHKDGTLVNVSVSISPLRDRTGTLIGAATIARDITERRQAERFREEFLNLAAHELRTPLTTMKGYAQILAKHGGHDDEERRLFRSLEAQTDRLAHLVQTLIDVSQIQSGDLVLFRRPIDLAALAGTSVAELAPSAPRHDLSLRAAEVVEVVADPRRISDVMFSLLDNAIKYSPRGGSIVVSVALAGDRAVFRVADQGIGIARDKQAELFSQFYQVAPMVSPTTGMGLGLYISREIVRRHGGQIWFESEEGVGSTFAFSLPIQAPA